jgi:hypothetical protein
MFKTTLNEARARGFGHFNLGFVSDFDIRILNFSISLKKFYRVDMTGQGEKG